MLQNSRPVSIEDNLQGQEMGLQTALDVITVERDHLIELSRSHHCPIEGMDNILLGLNMAVARVREVKDNVRTAEGS